MDVLKEILDWSSSRPDWQRDALRRFITQGTLADSDLEELVALCKVPHGLAERRDLAPLERHHIPIRGPAVEVVNLEKLTHHHGVNALASGQTITFGPGLTIVYGGNAAGKSGYTRILKRACRARGSEHILGNVLGHSAPSRPSATISLRVGEDKQEVAWSDQEETNEALGHVSVFDRQSAAIYLREKTDVAFRPFGLDLFDKLSDTCEEVRKVLERERSELASQRVSLPDLPDETAAGEFLLNITSLTKPEDVKKLGSLSKAELRRLDQVQKRLHDLQAEDPQKAARALTLRAERLERLSERLVKLDRTLADTTVNSLFDARDAVEKMRGVAEELQATTFPPDLLDGTGSDLWRALWEAARHFSSESAYPDRDFPVIEGDDARCVLCQQDLDKEASNRFQKFQEFIGSTVQSDLDEAAAAYREHRQHLDDLTLTIESNQEILEELWLEEDELAKSVQNSLDQAQLRRDRVMKTLTEGKPPPEDLPIFHPHSEQVAMKAGELRNRADHLLKNSDQETRDSLLKEQRELEARETLGKNIKAVLAEIERKKKLAAYTESLKDVGTTGITRKSTEVTKLVVTDQLARSFQKELDRLGFRHLEVELQAAGGTRGALFHKLVLKRAAGVDLPKVVSEGEAGTLSIAAFFSELTTAADKSAILFDDPVSSLDHEWREKVARRLAEEAAGRQVVVFTHDVVFLLGLVKFAEKLGVGYHHQRVSRETQGIGVSSPELPWIALKVKNRLGVVKKLWQSAEKLHRTGDQAQYEREAVHTYGILRETWERALEEVLLGGVVERYRPDIQTLRVRYLSDITQEDCEAVEAGVTKCSRWLAGHDKAPAENVPIPNPPELKRDIETLERWVKTVRKRRD
ncbi:MAG: AAA family ATPase [Nitrososphaerales archaeon]